MTVLSAVLLSLCLMMVVFVVLSVLYFFTKLITIISVKIDKFAGKNKGKEK